MDVTTVAKMHMDDLPARLNRALKMFIVDSNIVPTHSFVWVIFTNLRIVGAYLSAEEAYQMAGAIERAYLKSTLRLEIPTLASQAEVALLKLISEIIEHETDIDRPEANIPSSDSEIKD
jgi:hypothetical protein